MNSLELPFEWSAVTPDLLRVGAILLVAWVLYRVIIVLSRRLERAVEQGSKGPVDVPTAREQRGKTMAQILRNVAAVGLVIIIGLTVLSLFIPIGPLIAGLGIFGLAFSFGAQALVKDLISGFFMLVEQQYRVGDVIRINETTAGLVERITMRVVVLRDINGTVHTIPNGEIKQVANLTHGWSRAVLEVAVAYGEDIDRALETFREIGRELWEDPEWRPLLVEEPVVPGVERFEDSGVVIRLMAKTLPLKQWDTARELRRRIKNRLDDVGIEIPFPHRTLYWGDGQEPGRDLEPEVSSAASSGASPAS